MEVSVPFIKGRARSNKGLYIVNIYFQDRSAIS